MAAKKKRGRSPWGGGPSLRISDAQAAELEGGIAQWRDQAVKARMFASDADQVDSCDRALEELDALEKLLAKRPPLFAVLRHAERVKRRTERLQRPS